MRVFKGLRESINKEKKGEKEGRRLDLPNEYTEIS